MIKYKIGAFGEIKGEIIGEVKEGHIPDIGDGLILGGNDFRDMEIHISLSILIIKLVPLAPPYFQHQFPFISHVFYLGECCFFILEIEYFARL